jgi:hypothetical protein
VRYAGTPGAAVAPPASLPDGIPREAGKPTLVMVLHPRCACSRASLAELARILARLGERVSAAAIFVFPEPAWERGDLWAQAARIPGLAVLADERGAMAGRLRAETSGYTLLFDAGGALAYAGGITPARGHAGDSDGQDAILAIVEQGRGAAVAPVFGCPLSSHALPPGKDVEP